MSFGDPRGRTPLAAGLIGGILQGLAGFRTAQQDRRKQDEQDKLDTLRRILLQQQISQGAQQFQTNQADAATERQRRSVQDVQEATAARARLHGEFPNYQSGQAAFPLPEAVAGMVGGAPRGTLYPAQPESFGDPREIILQHLRDAAAANKQRSDQEKGTLAAKTRLLVAHLNANQRAGSAVDRARAQHALGLINAGADEDAAWAEANRRLPGAAPTDPHALFDQLGLTDSSPASEAPPAFGGAPPAGFRGPFGGGPADSGTALPWMPPEASGGQKPQPPVALPEGGPPVFSGPTKAQSGIALTQAQRDAAAANAAAIPQRVAETGRHNRATEDQGATRNKILADRQQTYAGMLKARETADAVRSDYQNRRLTLQEAQQAHREAMDATGTWFQKEQTRLNSLKATLGRSAASPQAAALRSQLAGLEKTRAQLQSAYNKYDQGQVGAVTGSGGTPPNPQAARVLGQKAQDLHDQITAVDGQISDAIGQLRAAPPVQTGVQRRGGPPVLPQVGEAGSPFAGPPASLSGSEPRLRAATGSARQRFIQRAMRNGASRQQAEQKANEFELR